MHVPWLAGDAGIDLSQLFVVPSYARRFGDHLSIGIAPILAGQRFRAKGLGSFPDLLAAVTANRVDLPTVFTFEGGYAVAEVGVNAVNLLQGFVGRRG